VPVAETSHAEKSISKPSTMGVRQLAGPSSVTSADDASTPPLLVDEDDETSLGDPSRPPLDEDVEDGGDFSSP